MHTGGYVTLQEGFLINPSFAQAKKRHLTSISFLISNIDFRAILVSEMDKLSARQTQAETDIQRLETELAQVKDQAGSGGTSLDTSMVK